LSDASRNDMASGMVEVLVVGVVDSRSTTVAAMSFLIRAGFIFCHVLLLLLLVICLFIFLQVIVITSSSLPLQLPPSSKSHSMIFLVAAAPNKRNPFYHRLGDILCGKWED
jgi:hypothetical protein